MSAPGFCLVLTTAPDEDTAGRLARVLVEEGLAACVTRFPGARSVYRWEGKTESAEEVQLVVKTVRPMADRAVRRLVELHPYDVPEALVVPIEGGHPSYLAWIAAHSVGEGDGGE